MFTWKPIYKEIAEKLLTYRKRQPELYKILKKLEKANLPVGRLDDENPEGNPIPLERLDPFTFLSFFNRTATEANRLKALAILKPLMGLTSDLPSDLDGIPLVNAQRAWFLPFSYVQEGWEIDALWDLAEQILHKDPSEVDPDLFAKGLKVRQVALAKLTIGLFWLRPDEYLPLEKHVKSWISDHIADLNTKNLNSWSAYLDTLKSVRELNQGDFCKISYEAFFVPNSSTLSTPDLDAGFQELLEKTASQSDCSVEELVDWLQNDKIGKGVENEITHRHRIFPLLGEALSAEHLDIDNLKSIFNDVWVLNSRVDSTRRSTFLSSPKATEIIQSLLEQAKSQTPNDFIDQFISDASKAGYRGEKGKDLANPAQFASVLLTSILPDSYVDFRDNRWSRLHTEILGDTSKLFQNCGYTEKLRRAASLAKEISETSTFQTYFNDQNPLWTIAGLAWSFRKGLPKISISGERRYWAGGYFVEVKKGDAKRRLTQFKEEHFWQTKYNRKGVGPKVEKHWELFDQIRVGDWFAIKGFGGKNDLVVHYVGEVIDVTPDDGVLKFKPLDLPFFHGKAPKLDSGTWYPTLVDVNSTEAIELLFGNTATTSIPPTPIMKISTNQILYGPPGTGKTYHATRRSVEIATTKMFTNNTEDHAKPFQGLMTSGQVNFVTFHQSFSYEDFIEGIRPVLSSEGGNATYECKDGVFKRMALEALYASLEPIAGKSGTLDFEALWENMLEHIEANPDQEYPGITVKTKFLLEVTTQNNVLARNVVNPDAGPYNFGQNKMKKVFSANQGKSKITIADVKSALGVHSHAHLATVLFKELKKIEAEVPSTKTPERAKTYEARKNIVQEYLNELEDSGYRLRETPPQYVLLIDEINRGNISKILGELVTLLEPDKRWGSSHALSVTLPYSGERFAVPHNLHVMGTMNTSDKSIALVDVALRRRFLFEELMPDFSICENLSDLMLQVLEELNRRIALRKDRDHQIGHSYFMNVDSHDAFSEVFINQVIPLLQEYFYNDWEGLAFVLGDENKDNGVFISAVKGNETKWARNRWEWSFKELSSPQDLLESLAQNYKLSSE